MQSDSKLQHALDLAAQGFYVFRLSPNTKSPIAGVSWKDESTIDPDKIRELWTDSVLECELDYNVAIDTGKSGLLVIDVDTKEGKDGAKSFQHLCDTYGPFPGTIQIRTASGGWHLYYLDTVPVGHRNTVSKLGLHIDTRGVGGFVVAEGTTLSKGIFKAVYERTQDAPAPAQMPSWLIDLLAPSLLSATATLQGTTISTDADIDIEAAIDFLKTAEPAVEGDGGDHHTFVTICQLKEFGISPQMACDLLEEHWNPNCCPPWDHSDLVVKIKSAYKSATQATGSRSATEFAGVYTGETPARAPDLAQPLARFKLTDIPPREWVFEGLALRKKVTIVVAPGGQGKSTFTLSLAVSKAVGKNILGIDPMGQGRVWLWNNEDDMEEQHRRLGAIMQHYAVPMDALFDKDVLGVDTKPFLFLNSGEQRAFRIAKRDANGLLKPQDAQAVIDSIRANKIDILIVDPFAETHPAKENDNEEILEVARMYRTIAQLANCAVILVHHTRKLDNASSDGHSGNLDSMRGASSLGGVARVVVTFNTMSKKQAKVLGVEERQRNRYAVLEGAKANFSAVSAGFKIFERFSETINVTESNLDGEQVGVLKPVKLESKAETPKETEYQLLKSIADCVEDTPKTMKEIAEQLTSEFAFYHDKRPEAVEKTIRRLFAGQQAFVLDGTGELVLQKHETPGGKVTSYIALTERATSLAGML